MTRTAKPIMAALVLIMLTMAAAPAGATDTPAPTKPDTTYTYTVEDRLTANGNPTVVTTRPVTNGVVDSTQPATKSTASFGGWTYYGCREVTLSVHATSPVGSNLYYWRSHHAWCWSVGHISTWRAWETWDHLAPFFDYKGVSAANAAGYHYPPPQNEIYAWGFLYRHNIAYLDGVSAYVSGHFEQSIFWATFHSYPRARLNMHFDGSYWGQTGIS